MKSMMLKEILKPPFYAYLGNACVKRKDIKKMEFLFNLGEGNSIPFTDIKDGRRLAKKFRDFVLQALNEKWERDHGERKRWIKVRWGKVFMYRCPECELQGGNPFAHCPHCGRRLDPPGED